MSHLLLFDPYVGGHHAEHVRHVLTGWHARYGDHADHRVTVAVAPDLITNHPDLLHLSDSLGPNVHLVEVTEAEQLGGSLLEAGLWHRTVLSRLIERYRPTHALLLYLDHAQLALVVGLRYSFPLSLSGILFRPSFHYGRFEATPPSLRERFTRLRKRLVLRGALRNPHLSTLFTLDPTAVPDLNALSKTVEAVALPDPVDPTTMHTATSRHDVLKAYGVEEGRTLALLFGLLAERKGVFAVIDALHLLSTSSAQRLTILLAGAARPEVRDRIHAAAATVSSPVQLLVHDEFVPDDEIQDLVQASDVVLVPYQRHVGSSGVLIRAAAAGRPVLGQDYGVVGQQIAQHRLGRTVDSTRPNELADAMEAFLRDPSEGFDQESARAFAQQNTIEAYQRVIFDHLRLGSGTPSL
jgi:glycosyltransferase involved in cell wall biosynthesis